MTTSNITDVHSILKILCDEDSVSIGTKLDVCNKVLSKMEKNKHTFLRDSLYNILTKDELVKKRDELNKFLGVSDKKPIESKS